MSYKLNHQFFILIKKLIFIITILQENIHKMKGTNKKLKNGVEKKPTYNKQFIEDFEKTYATILNNITNEWRHDQDSANDYENVRTKQVFEIGNIKTIFQPTPSEDFIEKAHVMIFTPKINKQDKIQMKNIITKCNDIIFTDYQNMKKDCQNKWFTKYKNEHIYTILQISKPLEEYKPNMWKLTFEPLNDIHGNGSLGWIPKKIQQFLGCFDEEWYKEVCERIIDE